MQQPSQMTIEREFEALLDIKRRSTTQGGPGALILDPDLPAQHSPTATAPLSPQAWTTGDGPASPTRGREDESNGGDGDASSDDPFHLFWVPAHLHPELAPSEFRAFLKEHATTPPSDSLTTAATALNRSSSSTSNLGRKRSMLSRQYKPRDNDRVEEEHVVPLLRKKSIYANEGPQLTISDLQKLEELADEASKSDDPTKLRKVLRRSMSLNVAPSFLDQMDDVPDSTDDADAPIIVPPPNQILRRAARTKIRKPNLVGDGGGHRFPASRKKSVGRSATVDVVATSPTDSSGHGETEPFSLPIFPTRKAQEEPEESLENKRLTYTEESSIFDAYADSPEEEISPISFKVISPPSAHAGPDSSTGPRPSIPYIPEASPSPQQPSSQVHTVPILHQPQPKRHLSPALKQEQLSIQQQQPSRTPSPEATSSSFDMQRPDSRSSATSEAPSHHSVSSMSAAEKRKEKEKKSLWRKVGGDKNGKKAVKDKDTQKEREKEKDSGFFGSLFGGKKKHEEQTPNSHGGGSGPAAAAALLGASKTNKAYSPSISPQLGNPYARYPIHVERAVYRLSHIKLANPRRPLYEQVLISNLMFWYLGVINKSNQGPGQSQAQQAQGQTNGPQTGQGQPHDTAQTPPATGAEKEHLEREQREREDREKVERERVEQKEREQRREPRRLTKQPTSGSSTSTGRRAEMPVKGPQYHLQSQVIEQEYSSVPGPAPLVRTTSAPTTGPPVSQGYNGGYSQHSLPVQTPKQPQQPAYSQPNGGQNYHYGRSGSMDSAGVQSQPSSPNLPPGAMAPLPTNEQLWLASQSSSKSPPRSTSSTAPSHSYSQSSDYSHSQQPPRSARSPPPNHHYSNNEWERNGTVDGSGGGKTPVRSLSANAASPPPNLVHQGHHSGGLKKKVASASAGSLDRRQRTSEEEDVPLAIWQQQRRK
ncbi:hypothetical protein DFH11DRAFT_1213250 [Phellopilus nigrolimitatus]|nr:hypothetical protein DFH11DRAFT_1213250 [Phellopilus nigrolimitatus]